MQNCYQIVNIMLKFILEFDVSFFFTIVMDMHAYLMSIYMECIFQN